MTHSCDLKDVLYSIDSTIWYKSAIKLLRLLNCAVDISKKVEIWSITDFLYHDIYIINNLSYKEKFELNNIITISKLYLIDSNKIDCFAIEINTNYKNRTELVAEITRIISKVLFKPSVLIFKNYSSIAFAGSNFSNENSSLEIFISEWFEHNMPVIKYYQLQEVDFYGEYLDYLYSIARPYQKYRESKTYLNYDCGFIIDEYGYVDKQTRFELIRKQYREVYGYDYFEEFVTNDYEEQEDEDIEWTLLELELYSLNLDTEEDDENNIEDDDAFDDYDEEYESDIFGDDVDKLDINNPENMLKFIRERKAGASS